MGIDRRYRGVVMPLVFIVAGVLLLLNSLDVLPWGVWQGVARLWPILVIGFGANLLWQHFRRI
jgi:hypothetical protein